MSIKKSIFKIFNGTSWDEYYHKTSADQVVYTKPDGTASNVQTELAEQNSAMKTVRGEFLSINKKLTFTACDVRKNGKIISLHINTPLSDNLTAGELIAIVPDGFRPTFNVNVPVTINEQKTTARIYTDGKINLASQWIRSTWLTFETTYIIY